MKSLIALITLLAALSASAQNFRIELTNLPPHLQTAVEDLHAMHQAACATNLVPYVYATNVTETVTATNLAGEPIAWTTNRVGVVTNAPMNLNRFCDELAKDARFMQLFREAVKDALANRERMIEKAQSKALRPQRQR